MPRVVVTEGAARGLENCRRFLFEKNPHASQKAAQTIQHHFSRVQTEPKIGRPLSDIPEIRELIIPFGNSGYVALYLFDEKADTIFILAFRHQKEAGY